MNWYRATLVRNGILLLRLFFVIPSPQNAFDVPFRRLWRNDERSPIVARGCKSNLQWPTVLQLIERHLWTCIFPLKGLAPLSRCLYCSNGLSVWFLYARFLFNTALICIRSSIFFSGGVNPVIASVYPTCNKQTSKSFPKSVVLGSFRVLLCSQFWNPHSFSGLDEKVKGKWLYSCSHSSLPSAPTENIRNLSIEIESTRLISG